MRYARFCDRDASVIALGTMDFGGRIEEGRAREFMDAYTEIGGNFIDTARIYGDFASGVQGGRRISLPQAVGTIMVMDIVFSIDSVITAVGLADHLIIMILAVIIAIVIMMAFIDPISNFINKNAEMKILALTFITMIGALLVLDSLGINSGIEVLDMHMEKLMVYFAMLFGVIMELIQIRYKTNLKHWDERTEDED